MSKKKTTSKLGLCLSGGGFRAALFHIGTLAALAEKGWLHKVEVLSTVSGGSIIGAYYYLKIKQLLEGHRPGTPAPTPEVYLEIVREIERDFLAAVQQNPRMHLLLDPWKTTRMMTDESYSRSDRMAEILDELFFDPITLAPNIHLNAIHITPPEAVAQNYMKDGVFDVDTYNGANEYKIPVLTINATCLNTGHPWHFTGSWVGEPQRNEQYRQEQNTNVILQQLRFDGTTQKDRTNLEDWQKQTLRKLTLAHAVAASAAVPGIFPPFPIHDLYKNSNGDDIVVELSDGGVFDNQGIDALINAGCTNLMVSDACGQLVDERLLGTDAFSVAMRSNDVMMERIRGWNYHDLALRQPSPFLHLRQEASNSQDFPALPSPVDRPGGLVYRISGLRTDLDSFSDIEAYSLMYHAYGLARDRLGTAATPPCMDWRFLGIRELVRNDLPLLEKHYQVGGNLSFKAFRLAPAAAFSWLAAFVVGFIVLPACYLLWLYDIGADQLLSLAWWNEARPFADVTVQDIAVLIAAGLPLLPWVREKFKTLDWARAVKSYPPVQAVFQVLRILFWLVAIISALVAWLHLRIFDRLFLKAGWLKP